MSERAIVKPMRGGEWRHIIIDDFPDNSQLRLRSNGIINKLRTTGRHYSISL